MIVFFSSRTLARSATFGKLVDFGTDAPKGKRFARRISAVSGNAKQRRKIMRAIMAGN